MAHSNKNYLDSISGERKNLILKNVANHYGISIQEAEQEVIDEDAEMLYEYIANDASLRMSVYNDFKGNKFANGGGVEIVDKGEKQKNIGLANDFFKKLKSIIANINYSRIDDNGEDISGWYKNKYVIIFTYYDGINSWSHQAQIVATDKEVYFISQYIFERPTSYDSPKNDRIKTYKKYIIDTKTNFGSDNPQHKYKVPISEKFIVLDLLTQYDDFKMINNFANGGGVGDDAEMASGKKAEILKKWAEKGGRDSAYSDKIFGGYSEQYEITRLTFVINKLNYKQKEELLKLILEIKSNKENHDFYGSNGDVKEISDFDKVENKVGYLDYDFFGGISEDALIKIDNFLNSGIIPNDSYYFVYNFSGSGQNIVTEYHNKSDYANGGGVPDYINKTKEQVWNSWTKEQRIHFIQDHDRQGRNAEVIAEFPYDDIHDTNISDWISEHIEMGQYANGGSVNTGSSWHLDRQKHNKSESWEKPMNKRKQRYDDGGGVFGGIHFLKDDKIVSEFDNKDLIIEEVSNYVADMIEQGYISGFLQGYNYGGSYRVDIKSQKEEHRVGDSVIIKDGKNKGEKGIITKIDSDNNNFDINYTIDFSGNELSGFRPYYVAHYDVNEEVAGLIRQGIFSDSNFIFGANVWSTKQENQKDEYGVSGIVWYVTKESAGDDYDQIANNVLSKDEFDDFVDDGKIEQTNFNIKAKYDWQVRDKIYAEMAENDNEIGLDYEEGRHIIGYKLLLDNQDSGFNSDLPYEVEEDDDSDLEFRKGGSIGKYAKGSTVKGEKSKIEITDDKEGRKIAKRTLVKLNSKGEKFNYELTVGLLKNRKKGWFEVYATDEDGEELLYSEGSISIEGGKVVDYDGVYQLNDKLKPLMSALNLNSSEVFDVFEKGGNVGRDRLFKSKQPHEQKYKRKTEWKEYNKEGWFGDWFANGGGVSQSTSSELSYNDFKDAVKLGFEYDEFGDHLWYKEGKSYTDSDIYEIIEKNKVKDEYANGGGLPKVSNNELYTGVLRDSLASKKVWERNDVLQSFRGELKKQNIKYANGGGVSYSDIKNEKEKMTDDLLKKCGVFFAFSNEQFNENKTPLKEGEKYVSIGGGGYMPKGNVDAFREGMKSINQIGKKKVKENNLAETEILYELKNHECFYTGDYSDVVDMFKGTYTEKQIINVYNKHRKANQDFENGGGVGSNEFYVGQSIIMSDKSPYYSRMTKEMKRMTSPYYNKELVIEEIINNKPHDLAKVFVRSSGQKLPFEIKLNEKHIEAYANGGGVGEFKVGDVVYNKEHNSIGIVRDVFDRNDLRTDADGVVYMSDLEHYDKTNSIHNLADIAPSTKKELGHKMANGGAVGEDSKIKDWYIKEYSSDDLGKELNSDNTFKDLLIAITNGDDVYSVLGVVDSVVRERAFAKLSKINNKGDQWAYNTWLMYDNGGVTMTNEEIVRHNMVNGEIDCDTLTEIIGHKPNYPTEIVGSLKLTKCFLKPYYKI